MGQSTLVINNVVHDLAPERPSQMLQQNPRGAYTSFVMRSGSATSDWRPHYQRLLHSILRLGQQINQMYTKFFLWQQEFDAREASKELPGAAELEILEQAILRSVGTASSVSTGSLPHREQMITVLVCELETPSRSTTPPFVDILVHCAPLHRPDPTVAVSAQIVGGARNLPDVKDSMWALERQPLEQRLEAGVAEGLLATPDGFILEGLVTNLFVVSGAGREAEVLTAGVEEGVLGGVMRGRVLEACSSLGIASRTTAPRMQDSGSWQEAFLTNSIRVVQPVKRIYCTESNGLGLQTWECNLPLSHGPVTKELQDWLQTKLDLT